MTRDTLHQAMRRAIFLVLFTPFFTSSCPIMPISIYHNPRCSKSRAALQWLLDHGHTPTVIEYLKNPPTAQQLAELLALLGYEDPRQLMRTQEAAYRELDLANPAHSPAALLQCLAAHPKLLERPIIVTDRGAVIARPLEKLIAFLA